MKWDRRELENRIENLDDITRQLADRRIKAEFSESIPAGRMEILQAHPDLIEKPDKFKEEALKVGYTNKQIETLLGYSSPTHPELSGHILKNEMPTEISTVIHEDLHRVGSPETFREMKADPALNEVYEGITEYFTQKAAEGLHGYQPGRCYPEGVQQAERIALEAGDPALRKFFFQHEMTEEVGKAIEKINGRST